MNWFPLSTFDVIDDEIADAALIAWGHWLGGCSRPFGRQSFGLFIGDALIAVAVSASTVNATCGGWERQRVVELARCCAHPDIAGQRASACDSGESWRPVAGRRSTGPSKPS